MKLCKLFMCVLLVTGIYACKKKPVHPAREWIQTEVVGSMVLDVDGSPIDSVKVFIMGRKGSVLSSFKDTLLTEGFTDKEGKFKISQSFPSDYRFSAKAILIDNRRNYTLVSCNHSASPCSIKLGESNSMLFVASRLR